jgi:UrcA family protein
VKTVAPIALAISLLAPAAFAPAAVAAEAPMRTPTAADETTSLRVSHADLALSQPQAAAIMFARLQRASMSVCGASQWSFPGVQNEVRRSACFQQSMGDAVASLDAPGVTALYQAQR